MPSAVSPETTPLPKWQRPAKTTHDLPWADIKVIDIGKFDEPGGKKQLAEELRQAVSDIGANSEQSLTGWSGSRYGILQLDQYWLHT